jgi:hypothetical protein
VPEYHFKYPAKSPANLKNPNEDLGLPTTTHKLNHGRGIMSRLMTIMMTVTMAAALNTFSRHVHAELSSEVAEYVNPGQP